MESLIVRAGACSPSNAPSRSALQIHSAAIVAYWLQRREKEQLVKKKRGLFLSIQLHETTSSRFFIFKTFYFFYFSENEPETADVVVARLPG